MTSTSQRGVRHLGGPWVVPLLAGSGLALGTAVGAAHPETYSAQVRLVVPPGEGEGAASLHPETRQARKNAESYAGWVGMHTIDGTWRPAEVEDVVASVPPRSTTVSIVVLAHDEEAALAGADHIADRLEEAVGRSSGRQDPDNALGAFRQRAPSLAAARTALDSAETIHARALAGDGAVLPAQQALDTARERYYELRVAQDADAALYRRLYTGSDQPERLQRPDGATSWGSDRGVLLLRNAAVGLLCGLATAAALTMLDRRRLARGAGGGRTCR